MDAIQDFEIKIEEPDTDIWTLSSRPIRPPIRPIQDYQFNVQRPLFSTRRMPNFTNGYMESHPPMGPFNFLENNPVPQLVLLPQNLHTETLTLPMLRGSIAPEPLPLRYRPPETREPLSQRLSLDLLADVATSQEYQPVAQPDPPVQMTPFPTPSASLMPFIHLPPGNHKIIDNTLFTIGDVDTVVYDPEEPKSKPKPKARKNAKGTNPKRKRIGDPNKPPRTRRVVRNRQPQSLQMQLALQDHNYVRRPPATPSPPPVVNISCRYLKNGCVMICRSDCVQEHEKNCTFADNVQQGNENYNVSTPLFDLVDQVKNGAYEEQD